MNWKKTLKNPEIKQIVCQLKFILESRNLETILISPQVSNSQVVFVKIYQIINTTLINFVQLLIMYKTGVKIGDREKN